MGMAWETTVDDLYIILYRNRFRLTEDYLEDGKPPEDMWNLCGEVLDLIQPRLDEVEDAAMFSIEIEDQTKDAYNCIENILREEGVLNDAHVYEYSFTLAIEANNSAEAIDKLTKIITDGGTGPGFERLDLWYLKAVDGKDV
jgi:hypothetical protein